MTDRKYLSCADTAKLVRQALKEAFPRVKFSVRSSVYSGGASINISWRDGPTTKQVDQVASAFKGARFDGMIDYKSSVTSRMNGELVRFGSDFIFTAREFSPAFMARRLERLEALTGCDLSRFEIKVTSAGNAYVPGLGAVEIADGRFAGRWADVALNILCSECSAGYVPKPSPTAAAVEFVSEA